MEKIGEHTHLNIFWDGNGQEGSDHQKSLNENVKTVRWELKRLMLVDSKGCRRAE
jgi:hypothetical protein